MEVKFKRFNPKTDIIKPFDCGDSDLNGFLLESNEDVPNATQHTKQLLAVTYLIEDIEARGANGGMIHPTATATTKRLIHCSYGEDLKISPEKSAATTIERPFYGSCGSFGTLPISRDNLLTHDLLFCNITKYW